jgi:hypothetical protein
MEISEETKKVLEQARKPEFSEEELKEIDKLKQTKLSEYGF